MGIYNDDFGHLLCPTEFDFTDVVYVFIPVVIATLKDSRIRASVREGNPEYPVTAGSWFNALYQEYQCNPADPEKGLFRSYLLFMVCVLIRSACQDTHLAASLGLEIHLHFTHFRQEHAGGEVVEPALQSFPADPVQPFPNREAESQEKQEASCDPEAQRSCSYWAHPSHGAFHCLCRCSGILRISFI